MIDMMEQVSGQSEVILFGETALQGFDSLNWDYETDRHMAVAVTDAPITRMREAAIKFDLAVSFGFIERIADKLYSSQIFIGPDGSIVHVFHRVSVGWKEFDRTDDHYREGKRFEAFSFAGKTFAIGLCGDLWTDGRPEEMRALQVDVVLWPVWCDYSPGEWNGTIKYEYAEQAALCGDCVLLVNPYSADPAETDTAAGGAACFRSGKITSELSSGSSGILLVEV